MPQITCPNCGQTYALTDEQAPQYSGQTITCTKCQKAFTVPNLVVVKLGTGGAIDIFNGYGTSDVVVDVVGWYG